MQAVSAIIINYRTPTLTVAAAGSALADADITEVIVVDNHSDDDSLSIFRDSLLDARVRIVSASANRGFGAGANLGAQLARGEFLLFLNSDAILRQGAVGPLLEELRSRPNVALVAPHVVTENGATQPDSYGEFPRLTTLLTRRNRNPRDTLAPDWVSGVAILVRAECFLSVGGFDPAFFMYYEDVDLCRRLRAEGYEVRRVSNASVMHVGGQSAPSSLRRSAYDASLDLYLCRAGYGGFSRTVVRSLRSIGRILNDRSPYRARPPT